MTKIPDSADGIPRAELVSIQCKGCGAECVARLSRDPDITASEAPLGARDRHFGCIATCLACGAVAHDARHWSDV